MNFDDFRIFLGSKGIRIQSVGGGDNLVVVIQEKTVKKAYYQNENEPVYDFFARIAGLYGFNQDSLF